MNAHFVCQPPRGTSWEVRLSRLPARLGRSEEADVRVDDRWVSRQHCQIEQRHGALFVKDLGSRHGTWVNEQRVEEAEIHPGDRLAIGMTTLTAAPTPQGNTDRLTWPVFLLGHVVAGLLGLAIGYYAMCCLRPAEFNWWHLPVPHVAASMLDGGNSSANHLMP